MDDDYISFEIPKQVTWVERNFTTLHFELQECAKKWKDINFLASADAGKEN